MASVPPTAKDNFRDDIQGMRALAVLSVSFYHFDFPWITGGFLGVDIFFAISGYLITGIILRDMGDGNFSLLKFYKRRIRRILPASLVTIILTISVGAVLFPPDTMADLSEAALWTTLFAANIYFSSAVDYFGVAATEQPLVHFWSLAVEEQFYFVWPFVIVAFGFTAGLRKFWVLLLALTTGTLIISEWMVQHDPTGAYYLPHARAFEFLLGAGAVFLERHVAKAPQKIIDILFSVALATIVVCLFTYTSSTEFPGVMALPPVVATTVLLGVGRTSRLAAVFRTRPAVFVGKISYSVYLVHWPLVVFYKFALGYTLRPYDQIALLAISLTLGWAMWRFVENPLRLHSSGTRGRAPSVIIAAMFGIILVPLAVTASDRSMSWRLGSDLSEQYAVWKTAQSQPTPCALRGELPNQYTCAFGNIEIEDTSIVVIGDSHSTQLRTPLWQASSPYEIKGMIASINGCPPIYDIGLIHERNPNWFESCRSRVRQALNYAIRTKSIEVVVLAARWQLYTRTTRMGENPAQGRVFLATTPADERSVERSQTVFRYRMMGTVQRLVDAGKKVVIIGQAPNLGYSPNRCFFSPVSALLANCQSRSYEEVESDTSFVSGIFRQAEELYPDDVVYVDPMPLFCGGMTCSHTFNGQMLYLDSNHLSQAGAQFVIGSFRDNILGFLPK